MSAELVADLITRATNRQLGVVELLSAGESLRTSGMADRSVELYRVWLASNEVNPAFYAVYFNLAITLADINDLNGAADAYAQSLVHNPEFLAAQINLGTIYERMGALDRAAAEWLGIVNKLAPVTGGNIGYKANAYKQIGRVFEATSQYGSAEGMLKNSLDLLPNQRDVIQHWVSNRQMQCKWPLLEPVHSLSVADIKRAMSPLSLSIYADDPLFELGAAYLYSRDDIGTPAPFFTAGHWIAPEAKRADRLRVGYLSSDLRGHAVGYLTSEIYELHDRNKVEVHVYFCGPRIMDATYQRIKAAADHWTDVNDLDDRALAKKIIADGIDILIDLNGHTKDARTKMLALKPAPIIINWLGYPGTMGSSYHQYILADDFIIPPEYEHFYTEKVLRLPCYQPNDRKRVVSPVRPTRAEAGLPEDAVVFVCFNGPQKITAATFIRWLTIVSLVPKGVLWMLVNDEELRGRLREIAASRGVAPERLFFANSKATPDHVARFPLGDLFLDTSPYGAHTTASDALWMGLPVVTLVGRGFASRVCGSLTRAAGLGELVCDTPERYVGIAVQLGNDPALLSYFRGRLADSLPTCTLFDTPKLVRHLEELYAQIWKDHEAGFVHVPKTTNLDVYHEIGTQLDHESVEFITVKDFENFYLQNLSYRDSFSRLPPDGRLWSEPQSS